MKWVDYLDKTNAGNQWFEQVKMILVESCDVIRLCGRLCFWQGEIFSYIHNLLSMPGYSPDEKQSVKKKTLQHMQVSTYSYSLNQYSSLSMG